MSVTASLLSRHVLVSFFILAYALTWLGAIPYAVGAFPVPMLAFGPFLAALVLASLTGGWTQTRSLLMRMVHWRVSLRWYACALLLPVTITVAAVCANVLFGAPAPSGDLVLRSVPTLVPIFAVSLLFPLSGAMGEELGWRGFALPRLFDNRSPLGASLILGILVAGWHTPLFVTGLYSQVPLRVLFIVATTVLYTLIANGTGGSILLAMLLHAALNTGAEFTFAWFSGADLERLIALYSLAGLAAALVAAVLAGPRLLRRSPTHQTLAPTPVAA